MFPYVTVGDALLDLPEVRPGEEVTEYTFNFQITHLASKDVIFT